MMKGRWWQILCLAVLCLGAAARADLGELSYFVQGGTLTDAPDYRWWYGCSPTSAGMMMGYYDNKGYSNLVPGVDAEMSTFGNPDAAVNQVIASTGHQYDFYSAGTYGYNTGGGTTSTGFGLSGDDVAEPYHTFNCLADFMGTSQDSVGNSNGGTTFYYDPKGYAVHYDDLLASGQWSSDGMYGIYEYVRYAGYDVVDLYTQATAGPHKFTFNDYKAEIDAGRVVMIHVKGHSMFGYGYDGVDQVLLHETWYLGQDTMTWGGSFSGMEMWGVTVLELAPVPLPAAVLLGMLGLGVAGVKLRKLV